MNNISQYKDDEFNFSSLKSSISRRKKSFFLIAFSIFILSGIYAFKKKSIWEGTFQIVLRQNNKMENVSSLLSTRNPISLLRNQVSQNKLNTEVLILQSPSVLKPIYDFVKTEYNFMGYDTSGLSFRKWKKNLNVKLEKKSNILKISYLDNEKKLIIPVLNKISEKYQEYSGKDRLKSLTNAKKYLDQQVSIYKVKTNDSSNELQAFANLHNIGLLNTTVDSENLKGSTEKRAAKISTNSIILDLENKYIGAKNQIMLIDEKLDQLKNLDPKLNIDQKIAIYSSQVDTKKIAELKALIQKIDSELIRYKSGFKNNYPKIKNLEKSKNVTFLQLKDFVIGNLQGKKTQAKAIQEASKRPQEVIEKYKNLFRQHKLDLETLSNLELERKINELSLAKKTDPWELISNPLVFDKPVAPNRLRILMVGIFFGLTIASLYVKTKDNYSDLINDKKDIDNILGYKNLYDFSDIEENKLKEIIDIFLSQNFVKDKSILLTLGDFSSDRLTKTLSIIKENKTMVKIVKNLGDIENSSKVLVLISINNLSKRELIYSNKIFGIRNDLEIYTAYI